MLLNYQHIDPNFLQELESVFFWVTEMEQKATLFMIYMAGKSLFQEMLSFMSWFFPK